jgi:hypothetical protein
MVHFLSEPSEGGKPNRLDQLRDPMRRNTAPSRLKAGKL